MKPILFLESEEAVGGAEEKVVEPAATPEPAAASEPVVTPETPAPEVSKAWYESLKEHGLPSGKDEAETVAALKRLAQEREALEGVRPYIPHVNEYIKNAAEYAKWKAEQTKAAPKAAESPWWSDMWSAPEYDPSWERYIVIGEDGERKWSPEATVEIQQKYQAYQSFTQEKAREFLRNPYEFIGPAIEKRARAIAEEVVQSNMRQSQAAQTNEQFVRQNEWWLYERDGEGENSRTKTALSVDPFTGRQVESPVLSQQGRQYVGYVQQILQRQKARGYEDDEEAREMALVMVQKDYAMAQLAALPAASPSDVQQKKNKEFLDKANPAGKAGGRAGNMKPAEEEVNGRNFERILRQELEKSGAL